MGNHLILRFMRLLRQSRHITRRVYPLRSARGLQLAVLVGHPWAMLLLMAQEY